MGNDTNDSCNGSGNGDRNGTRIIWLRAVTVIITINCGSSKETSTKFILNCQTTEKRFLFAFRLFLHQFTTEMISFANYHSG